MGKENKLKNKLTQEEKDLNKRIEKEMLEMQVQCKAFAEQLIELGFLTGTLKFASDELRSQVNKAIFKTQAYLDICKARKALDLVELKHIPFVEDVSEVVKLQNEGYKV